MELILNRNGTVKYEKERQEKSKDEAPWRSEETDNQNSEGTQEESRKDGFGDQGQPRTVSGTWPLESDMWVEFLI